MCGEMGKAVLRALTGALLCGLVSHAAYLHQYDPYEVQYEQGVVAAPAAAPARAALREHEKPQDLRNVPGAPGVDYPVYHRVPDTHFSCDHVPARPGMYANVETGCQAYHVCHDGREGQQGASFLCTNGTLFDQAKFACDWWYNVDCSKAIDLYKLNADPNKNPYVPKPKPEDQHEHQHEARHQHQPQYEPQYEQQHEQQHEQQYEPQYEQQHEQQHEQQYEPQYQRQHEPASQGIYYRKI